MKNFWLIFFLSLFAKITVYSQCTGTQLNWQNPSFEGTPQPHVTPPLWNICQPGTTPDTQPGSWGITLPPTNGNTYIGLVDQTSGNWHEGASQQLSSPMITGTTYNFTIDLATTNSTGGGLIPGCCELQIWGNMGGSSGCDMTFLLWSSGNVYPLLINTWATYTVSFTATQPWTNILFMIHNLGCTDEPYIMMDNLTPINPISDVPQFTWTNVCIGNTMQFTDSSTSSQGVINSWNWDFGDGSPPNTTQNPSHFYTFPGTYNTTLTITSTVPCTTTVTNTVIVYPLPTISVTPGNTSICSGGSVTCTANGGATYQWAPSTGLSSTSGTTVTANPTATTTYSVTGTDANGCVNTTSFTITVSPIPTPTIAPVDASCGLNNGSATVSPAGLTYLWSNSQTTQTISNLAAGTYTVTVSDNGCTATASCILVNSPSGSVTLTSTHEYCGYSNGTATATVVGGTAPFNYIWSNSQSAATISSLPAGTYTVTTSDVNGCTATGSTTVTNIAGPALQTTPTSETCSHGDGSVTSAVSGGTQPYSYLWSNGSTATNIINLSQGSYTLTVTDSNNCFISSTAVLTNMPGPVADFSMHPHIVTLLDGNVSFTDYSTGTVVGWSWDFGDGASSNLNNPDHEYTQLGTFIITEIVMDNNGCSDTIQDSVIVKDIYAIYIPSAFTPNGNLVNDVFLPKGINIDPNNYEMDIFDRWGNIIFKTNDLNEGWNGTKDNNGNVKKVVMDVYVYRIKLKEMEGPKHEYLGRVTLVP